MHSSLLFGVCLVVLANAAPNILKDVSSEDEVIKFHSSMKVEEEWEAFKTKYEKTYADASDEIFRKKIFAEHLEKIEAHNRLYSEGLKSFTMGINRFSDLETSEFVKLMNGYKSRNPSQESRSSKLFVPQVNASLPTQVDWRTKGYVTRVKSQKECGGCWAFAATGTLEGQHFRKTGKLVNLSEQQLLDCSTENDGCDGGMPFVAIKYIAKNGGIDTEESYPYEAAVGRCRYDPGKVGATCKKYVLVQASESALQEAVATIGPISVGIDASRYSFQYYRSGVYDEPACRSNIESLNHAVLVVGYGETRNKVQYWIVKNSWSTDWGIDGYILMSRNKKNQCGISLEGVYPEV